jgi:hypothetical protein
VNPFIIACGTKNVKFTSIAIVCLQRLIVAHALPRSKLNQVLEALREAASASLDVQLKILQGLPSLLQNYSADIKGDLLVTALNVCFILQTSKNAIVNNTSAATLQQLVVFVFDKVVAEDSEYDGRWRLMQSGLTGISCQETQAICQLSARRQRRTAQSSFAQRHSMLTEYGPIYRCVLRH